MTTVSAGLVIRDFSDSSLDLREGSVSVEGSYFAEVPTVSSRVPDLHYPDHVICPGLMDSHVHLAFDSCNAAVSRMNERSEPENLRRMAEAASALVASGTVFARDLGSPGALAVEARRQLERGLSPGLSLQVAGRPLTRPGGHCWFMGGEVSDARSAAKAVDREVSNGANAIKVMVTGGRMTPGTDPRSVEMPREWLRAIAREAHSLGCLVSAHALSTEGVIAAAEGGVDIVEHGTLIGSDPTGGRSTEEDLADRERAIGLMSQNQIVLSPTFREMVVDTHPVPYAIRADWISGMVGAGVPVVAGTDSGIPGAPHSTSLVAGLRGLVRTGLSRTEALASASRAGMRRVGRELGGWIAKGQPAEFIVLKGDPRVNLDVLKTPVAVMAGGVLLDLQ